MELARGLGPVEEGVSTLELGWCLDYLGVHSERVSVCGVLPRGARSFCSIFASFLYLWQGSKIRETSRFGQNIFSILLRISYFCRLLTLSRTFLDHSTTWQGLCELVFHLWYMRILKSRSMKRLQMLTGGGGQGWDGVKAVCREATTAQNAENSFIGLYCQAQLQCLGSQGSQSHTLLSPGYGGATDLWSPGVLGSLQWYTEASN